MILFCPSFVGNMLRCPKCSTVLVYLFVSMQTSNAFSHVLLVGKAESKRDFLIYEE